MPRQRSGEMSARGVYIGPGVLHAHGAYVEAVLEEKIGFVRPPFEKKEHDVFARHNMAFGQSLQAVRLKSWEQGRQLEITSYTEYLF